MLIDLHCHTLKTKKGDKETRNVTTELFKDKINQSKVKLVAITNHNHFNYQQYKELSSAVKGNCMIWPGIEFDIKSNEQISHLIIIANPKNVLKFSQEVDKLIGIESADSFFTTLEDVVKTFDQYDVIYLPHYHKTRGLSDSDINELESLLSDKTRLFKELSNTKSLGVYANFGYNVIVGSDVQNWENYEKSSFSEVRLPFKTFEQFCLLAKRDKQVIDSLLSEKKQTKITVSPNQEKKISISIPIYEEINIIFGQKGTGKTEIVKSLKEHYANQGISCEYYSGISKEEDFNLLLSTKNINRSSSIFKLDEMTSVFEKIKEWKDEKPTKISEYIKWYETKNNNINKANLKITNCTSIKPITLDQNLQKDYQELDEFLKSNFSEINFEKYLSKKNIKELKKILELLKNKIRSAKSKEWKQEKIIHLTNYSIDKIKKIADKCSNTVSKPSNIGFFKFSENRFNLFKEVSKLTNTFSTPTKESTWKIGILDEKGEIYISTKYRMLCQDSVANEFDIGIRKLRKCKSNLEYLEENIFSFDILAKISEFKEDLEDNGINKISDFIGISKKTKLLDGMEYNPSGGEKGILILQEVLNKDSDIYLLDEPELGMGNSYVTASILPDIMKLAKNRKTVVIATHNANLAVSTLPYTSIYREHTNGEYKTYVGNPFYDDMVNIDDVNDIKSWSDISIHTLEGGSEAFYGRKGIYESK